MAGGNTVLYLLQGGIFLCRRKKQSSITKNFVISGQKQVEMFADAIEASANDRPVRIPVSAKEIKGEAELRAFMEMRKKANANKG